MSNLRQLLHPEVLTATYDKGAAGVQTPLTDRYYTSPQNWDTDEASFLVRPETRTAAPLNKPYATARQLALQGKSKKAGAMFHSFNSFTLSPEVFQGLMDPESSAIQRIARREINDQMEHFSRMHQLQKELVLAKILTTGVVYIDANGQILESSSGAVETCSFGIDANHQGTANGLAQPFDDPHTDIESMFEDIRDQARAESAPPPEVCICNSDLKRLIRRNVNFRYFAAQNVAGERVLYGELVEGLFGMDWIFIDSQYTDAGGSNAKMIPDEKLILVPKSNDWIQAVAGLTLVPTKIEIQNSIDQLVASTSEVYGPFSYAKAEHNPLRLDVYAGDAYGYIVREPNAIWQLDVKFS